MVAEESNIGTRMITTPGDKDYDAGWELRQMMVTGTMSMITTTATAAVMTTIMTTTVGRVVAVAVLKTEPLLVVMVAAAAAAEAEAAVEVAEAAAVATVRADNNQQIAKKTEAAAIAVGKRRQARMGKEGRAAGAAGDAEPSQEVCRCTGSHIHNCQSADAEGNRELTCIYISIGT